MRNRETAPPPARRDPTGRSQAVRHGTSRSPAVAQTGRSPAVKQGTVRSKAVAPASAERSALAVKKKKKHLAYLIFTALTALLVIVLAVVLRGVSDMRTYTQYMERAQSYYRAGELDSALVYFRKAANVNATDECLLWVADCYEAQGSYENAVSTLNKLSSPDASVVERISSLEERRSRMAEAGMVTVAGKQYAAGTTGLALDNMGLTDAVLTEVCQLYSLSNLSLAGNQISDVSALAAIGGLTTLNLSGNSVSDLSPLSSLTSLRTLYLDYNPVSDLSPLYSLANLTMLSIKGIGITESQLNTISTTLPNCAIHSETAAEEAQDISLGGYTFKSDVTELDLRDMGLRDVSALSSCKLLTKLNLSGNDINDLSDIMDIPGLTWLDISSNNISDVRPLMGMTTLTYVNAAGNSISNTVPFSSLRGLTELYLDNNPITNLSGVRNLYNLQTLSASGTDLQDADLQRLAGLSSLTVLNIENNPLLSGEAVDMLKQAIPTCAVTHSELSYSISMDGYAIASDVTELSLSGCGITDISAVSRLDHLTSVELARNNISNIYPFQYSLSTPNIKYLDLSSNYLEDITLVAAMISLETLDVSNNNITLISPLMVLTNLRTLRITGNPMTPEQIADIQAALPYCEIIFE